MLYAKLFFNMNFYELLCSLMQFYAKRGGVNHELSAGSDGHTD